MNRLTKQIIDMNIVRGYEVKNQTDANNKLGKYEDLEEKIGCPLEVRCKVVFGLIVYNKNGEQLRVGTIYADKFLANCFGYIYELKYVEYKKTWWLKSDKSE